MQVAELLENALGKIAAFDAEENIAIQTGKQALHRAFIYAAAEAVAAKADWDIAPNYRRLDAPAIKTYINEVFLKQQLLDYQFRTLRARQLASYPQPLIHGYLREQQRIRQLEVVKTSRYLFAVAPSVEKDINIFSLRRFLAEERLLAGGNLYLNVAALDLFAADTPEQAQVFTQHIERIVTLEGMVSQAVIDLATQMEENYDSHILPALMAPLDAGALSLDKAIGLHLQRHERQLTSLVLDPLVQGLTRLVSHQDECDYLYVTTRQLFSSIIGSFQDFQLQPALLGNDEAARMMTRLVGYVTLLKKRREDIFTLMPESDWQARDAAAQKPVRELDALIKSQHKEYTQLEQATARAKAAHEAPASFFDRLFKRKAAQLAALEELEKKANRLRSHTWLAVTRLAREHRRHAVFMEYESLLSQSGTWRNYGFSHGNNGAGRLPLLQTLPENPVHFDLARLQQQFRQGTAAP